MKTKSIIFPFFLTALTLVPLRAAPDGDSARTVVLVANDALKFNVTQIEAAPGERLHVQLRNDSSMPKSVMTHNWVLLKSGKLANDYSMAAASAASEGYQPQALAGNVLAAIPALGPHETGDVTFNAPTAPGRYEFLCSSPAHCAAGMRGELIVR